MRRLQLDTEQAVWLQACLLAAWLADFSCTLSLQSHLALSPWYVQEHFGPLELSSYVCAMLLFLCPCLVPSPTWHQLLLSDVLIAQECAFTQMVLLCKMRLCIGKNTLLIQQHKDINSIMTFFCQKDLNLGPVTWLREARFLLPSEFYPSSPHCGQRVLTSANWSLTLWYKHMLTHRQNK